MAEAPQRHRADFGGNGIDHLPRLVEELKVRGILLVHEERDALLAGPVRDGDCGGTIGMVTGEQTPAPPIAAHRPAERRSEQQRRAGIAAGSGSFSRKGEAAAAIGLDDIQPFHLRARPRATLCQPSL